MYTHLADLEWGGVVDGASTYTVTQTEDAGPETIILDAVTDSFIVITSDTLPGSSYVYSIYSDLDLVTPILTINETADLVTSITVQLLMTRISNDITVLTQTAISEISSLLREILTTGDVLSTNIGTVTFVENAAVFPLPDSSFERILTPFETGSGTGQTITITMPDASTEILTYDHGNDEVISSSTNYSIGKYFKSGEYKITVVELE